MKKYIAAAAAFIGVHVAVAYLAWLSGFDFDKRGDFSAGLGFIALLFGGIGATMAYGFAECA